MVDKVFVLRVRRLDDLRREWVGCLDILDTIVSQLGEEH